MYLVAVLLYLYVRTSTTGLYDVSKHTYTSYKIVDYLLKSFRVHEYIASYGRSMY